ncbi:MAG: creatininase family protein, partial [Aphanizomenon sp.]
VASGHKIYSSVDFRLRYPDGRMGSNPDLATTEHGKQFYDLAVEELSQGYREFMKEE